MVQHLLIATDGSDGEKVLHSLIQIHEKGAAGDAAVILDGRKRPPTGRGLNVRRGTSRISMRRKASSRRQWTSNVISSLSARTDGVLSAAPSLKVHKLSDTAVLVCR